MRKIFLFVFSILCSFAYTVSFNDEGKPEDLAAAIVAEMSDADALAQIFMFGWRDIGGSPSALIQDWINKRHIGSIKVFGWNTSDTALLARNILSMQRQSLRTPYNLPLLVATDQEGGIVHHVRGDTALTPGAMAIGASGYPQDAYLSGFYIGKELSIIGINMNFAPTVDLYTNHGSVLIGPRSFGDNPAKAGIMGIAFARGLLASGVIPTAKHFPGHGDTALDSHGTLPTIKADFETLWERELVPYRMMAMENIPAIMSGHIAFPNTEARNTSASLSSFFLTDVLRKKINFKGLIVTDDMAMNGATAESRSLWRSVKSAVMAGNDIIMMSGTPEFDSPIWINLTAAMNNEPSFNARVREAAQRVITAKLKYLKGDHSVPTLPDLQKVQSDLPLKEGEAFFADLAVRSVTLIKNAPSIKNAPVLLPLDQKTEKRIFLAGQNLDFFNHGKKIFSNVGSYWYSSPVTTDFLNRAASSDIIIFYLSNSEGLDVLKSLRALGKKIIVLSVLSPAYLEDVPWIDAAIAVYSHSPSSIAAGFSALLGRIQSSGNLPFVME